MTSLKEEKNPSWKGDDVGYWGVHDWVRYHKDQPEDGLCEMCKKAIGIQWANKSGKYQRDLGDWEWLCPKCHKYRDSKRSPLGPKRERRIMAGRHRVDISDRLYQILIQENQYPEKLGDTNERILDDLAIKAGGKAS